MKSNTTEIESWHLFREDDAGTTSAVLVPTWGANLIALSFQPRELAEPISLFEPADLATIARKPTSWGNPLMAPTPGRVSGDEAGFTYGGRRYRVVPVRHGFVRDRAWKTVEATTDRVVCALDVAPRDAADGTFPYRFECRYEVELIPGGACCTFTIESRSDRTQPLHMGWHPYLHRPQSGSLHVPASRYWELNQDGEPTPTGRILPVEKPFDPPRPLGWDEHWDACLTGLPEGNVSCWTEENARFRAQAGGDAEATVRRVLSFSTTTDGERQGLRHVQLFTPPGRHAVCIEPMSSPPDAVNLKIADHRNVDLCELPHGAIVKFKLLFRIDHSLR
jgi:aldose 1-epimerase